MTTLTPALEKLVDTFCLTPAEYEYPDKPFADLWRGSGVNPSISDYGEGYYRLDRWLQREIGTYSHVEEVEDWTDYPYRITWRIADLRAHVTHCEGDVSLLVARSDDDYAAINRSADNFYATHA